MSTTELVRTALALPLEERLDLARQLVESVIEPAQFSEAVKTGMRRIEDVASGRVTALTEEEFRAALK